MRLRSRLHLNVSGRGTRLQVDTARRLSWGHLPPHERVIGARLNVCRDVVPYNDADLLQVISGTVTQARAGSSLYVSVAMAHMAEMLFFLLKVLKVQGISRDALWLIPS